MNLSASHGIEIFNPTDQQINHAIEDIEDNNGSFVILDTENDFFIANDFVQTTGSLPDKLLVEYNSDEKQFQTISQNLTTDQVKDIFIQFRHGLSDFKIDFDWKELELSKSGGAGCGPILFILFTVLVWQMVL